jgi:hypothetical protein
VAHQQLDRRFVLAEHDEELGLLLEVDQLLDRELTHRLGGRRHRRCGLRRQEAGRHLGRRVPLRHARRSSSSITVGTPKLPAPVVGSSS